MASYGMASYCCHVTTVSPPCHHRVTTVSPPYPHRVTTVSPPYHHRVTTVSPGILIFLTDCAPGWTKHRATNSQVNAQGNDSQEAKNNRARVSGKQSREIPQKKTNNDPGRVSLFHSHGRNHKENKQQPWASLRETVMEETTTLGEPQRNSHGGGLQKTNNNPGRASGKQQ